MILPAQRKNERPSFFVPVGIVLLTILATIVIVLSTLILTKNEEILNQQKYVVTLLNNLKANQQKMEVLYSETPGERSAKSSELKVYVPRDEYNRFKKEYIREIKRLRKQIQNLKALL